MTTRRRGTQVLMCLALILAPVPRTMAWQLPSEADPLSGGAPADVDRPAAGDNANNGRLAGPRNPLPAGAEEEQAPESFIEILTAGGTVGMVIMGVIFLLSVGTVALVLEHLITIRAAVLMPPELGEDFRELLAAGQFGKALERCEEQPSFLAFVLRAGLSEIDGQWPAVEKAMEDATAEQAARLFRKIEYLSVIGNIAPMVGLLGTVVGMILAFREVATTQGAARAADLAEGIYQALVTTVGGLIVAIPSLAAFAVFRNRVDHLVAETTYVALHSFAPFKRRRVRRTATTTVGVQAEEGTE